LFAQSIGSTIRQIENLANGHFPQRETNQMKQESLKFIYLSISISYIIYQWFLLHKIQQRINACVSVPKTLTDGRATIETVVVLVDSGAQYFRRHIRRHLWQSAFCCRDGVVSALARPYEGL
jgi:hypothetical protein